MWPHAPPEKDEAAAGNASQVEPITARIDRLVATIEESSTLAGVIGRVTYEGEAGPVPHARVTFTGADGQLLAHVTDEHGWYATSGLAPGRYSIATDLDGRVAFDEIEIQAGDLAALDLEIARPELGDGPEGSPWTLSNYVADVEPPSADGDYIRTIPTGRRFDDAMFTSDLEGITFSSGTTIDNVYVVEGLHGTVEDAARDVEDEAAGVGADEAPEVADSGANGAPEIADSGCVVNVEHVIKIPEPVAAIQVPGDEQ